jgi:NitT/TauT family transport system ATP-binding protein
VGDACSRIAGVSDPETARGPMALEGATPALAAIEVSNVSKQFVTQDGSIQEVLHDISCELVEGHLTCLLGPTGCGKSTLLNLIAGFEPPTSGRITAHGRPVTGPSRERMVVFQDAGSALFAWRTALENVEYPLKRRGIGPTAKRRAMCNQLLALVHLENDGHKFPHQLSGGGKQRAQIARALAADPGILLMDEPLAALDALTKLALQREIVALVAKTQKTILYVTHDIYESALISDRVIILSKGPRSVIRHDLMNPLPKPRTLADPAVAAFVGELEKRVVTRDVD